MTVFLALIGFIALCNGQELCSNDKVPDLNGAWVCDDDWLVDTKEDTGEIDGSKKWFLYFELPKFYAVSKIRTIPSCEYDEPLLHMSVSVWDERYDKGAKDLAVVDESRWTHIEIKAVDFVGNISQEYTGFARRAPYWRLEVDTFDIIKQCLPRFTFFARAGIAATQHFHMQLDFPPEQKFEYSTVDAPSGNTCDRVTGVPYNVVSRYRLDTSFYRKYTSAYGIPVMGSYAVDDKALQRACYVVRFMMADRKDLRDHMYSNKGRVAIIGRRETVPMVPEMRIYPGWTRRAAGGTFQNPVNVGAEENMLCERGDGYAREQDIFMHEFAHGIHLIACHTALPSFNSRLQRSFNYARSRGLWSNTYANTDNREYFAEGVQAFFNQQREGPPGGDGIQNNIDTRPELRQHDPTLYNIIDELFPCINDYIPRCNDLGQGQGLRQKLKQDCRGGVGTTLRPGTTPPIHPGSCSNDHRSCAYWAGIGECGKNPEYMLVNCRKSCNTCPKPTTSPTTEPTTSLSSSTTISSSTTASTTTTSTTKPGACEDSSIHCSYWAGNGECDKNPDYMLVNCSKSCNSCPKPTTSPSTTPATTVATSLPSSTTISTSTTASTTTTTPVPCQDNSVYCGDWAYSGECETNPDYMLVNCSKSCNSCPKSTTSPSTTPTTTVATSLPPNTTISTSPTSSTTMATSTTKPGACEDYHRHCGYWAGVGECDNSREYMEKNCGKSCRICTGSTCVDADVRCQGWRSYCSYNQYVITTCKKLCNLC